MNTSKKAEWAQAQILETLLMTVWYLFCESAEKNLSMGQKDPEF